MTKYDFNRLPLTWKWRISKAGLTIDDIQERSGVSRSLLLRSIRGTNSPSLKNISAVEKVLLDNNEPFKMEYIEDE